MLYCHIINNTYAGHDFVDTIGLGSEKQEALLHCALCVVCW